jgi:hypothetical protein
LTFANVVSVVALVVALGGTATAAGLVTGKSVKNGSLTGADVRDNSLKSADVKDGALKAKDFKKGQLPAGDPGPPGQAGPPGPVVETLPPGATLRGTFNEEGYGRGGHHRSHHRLPVPAGGSAELDQRERDPARRRRHCKLPGLVRGPAGSGRAAVCLPRI